MNKLIKKECKRVFHKLARTNELKHINELIQQTLQQLVKQNTLKQLVKINT
jgi:hypothetical protein